MTLCYMDFYSDKFDLVHVHIITLKRNTQIVTELILRENSNSDKTQLVKQIKL